MSKPKSNNNLEEITSRMVHDVRNSVTILNMLAYTFENKAKERQESLDDLKIMQEELDKIEKIVSSYRENIKKFSE